MKTQGDPMELNLIEKRRSRSNKRKSIRQPSDASAHEKKCYEYDKLDHIARNYRSKNKIRREEINIIEVKDLKQYFEEISTEADSATQEIRSKILNKIIAAEWQTVNILDIFNDKKSDNKEFRR